MNRMSPSRTGGSPSCSSSSACGYSPVRIGSRIKRLRSASVRATASESAVEPVSGWNRTRSIVIPTFARDEPARSTSVARPCPSKTWCAAASASFSLVRPGACSPEPYPSQATTHGAWELHQRQDDDPPTGQHRRDGRDGPCLRQPCPSVHQVAACVGSSAALAMGAARRAADSIRRRCRGGWRARSERELRGRWSRSKTATSPP